MKKKVFLLIVLILIILLIILFFCLRMDKKNTPIDKTNYSQLYLYDLGKSNIELIIKNDFVIMINTGLEEDRDNLLDYLDKLGITEIDYLILTNRDDKYIGNASFIIENFKVEYLYLNDYNYSSEEVEELLNILFDSYTEEIILTSNENIVIDNLNINIYPYLENDFNMDDKTLIVNIKEGKNSIYLTSNSSNKRLDEIDSSSLIVSENKSFFDIKAKYYIYDRNDVIKDKDNLLKRNINIYFNEKEFIIE